MKPRDSKPLSSFIFIPLLSLIFVRPFVSGLAYPSFELYYEDIIIFLAILTVLICALQPLPVHTWPSRTSVSIENMNRLKMKPYTIPIIILLCAYLTSTFFSVNIKNSIKEFIKFISCVSVFFIISQLNIKQKKQIIKTIVLAAVIISIYSMYQYFWGYQRTLDYIEKLHTNFLYDSSYARDILLGKRAIGTFPSPNILGGFLIIAFFLCQGLDSRGPKLISLSAITFALVLTKSMGAWLSIIACLTILFIYSYKSLKKQRMLLITAFAAIILVLIFIITSRWERLLNLENPQNSITQRLNYWMTAIFAIKDHALFGVGPGNFKEVFLNYKVGLSTNTRYAHNIMLHMWIETGILGLMGVSLLIFNFLKKSMFKPKNGFILFAGLAFILHNFIDNTYFLPQAGLFWWALLGLTL